MSEAPDPLVAKLTVENAALRNEVAVLNERLNRRTKALRQIHTKRSVPIPTDTPGVWEWDGRRWVPERTYTVVRELGAQRSKDLADLLVAEHIWNSLGRFLDHYLGTLDAGDVTQIGYARSYLDHEHDRWRSWRRVHRGGQP